jgi:threonine/homoserine/homoserine lactone efflux protein
MAIVLWTFVPVAFLLSLTPGPGMALVVRNAAVGGARAAVWTTVGSSIGVGVWAVLSAVGISALVAASVFFVALFLQFIPEAAPVLPYALTMAAILIVADFAIYVSLGAAVASARRLVTSTSFARRVEQATGAVLLALAGRLALTTR